MGVLPVLKKLVVYNAKQSITKIGAARRDAARKRHSIFVMFHSVFMRKESQGA